MSLFDWFPALTTTSLFVGALWLLRKLIINRLTKSVGYEFDAKLEVLRAELHEADEKFKADLRAKETEMAVLRSGALTAMASQQMALDKRRMEAVDQLWTSFTSFNTARWLTSCLKVIKFDEAVKSVKADPSACKAFEMMGMGFNEKLIEHTGASKAKPFVSVMVWATYTAYTAICYHAIFRWKLLTTGLAGKDFVNHEETKKLILVALPHQAELFEKFGPDSYYFVLEELEKKLLQEIQNMLSGAETDQKTIQRASEILKASNAAIEQASRAHGTI